MEPRNLKVALLGDINIDVFLNIPVYPPPGGDALVYEMVLRTGGSVANSAIVLSRLGITTQLFSHTGNDVWADIALDTLRKEGVGLEDVVRDTRSGTGLIFLPVTPDGERTMFSYRGANVLQDIAEITSSSLSGVDLLHLSGYSFLKSPQKEAAWQAVDVAEKNGIAITLDLGVEPAVALGDDLGRLLKKLDVLVLGDSEAMIIGKCNDLDQAVENLLASGVKLIGLKLGKHGCKVITSTEQVMLPGFSVNTIDTTGAGDAFSAAMIYSRLRGLSLNACGVLANALGALATTVWGGGSSLPELEDVLSFLNQQQKGSQPWDSWVNEVTGALKDSGM
jgi:ribokinase